MGKIRQIGERRDIGSMSMGGAPLDHEVMELGKYFLRVEIRQDIFSRKPRSKKLSSLNSLKIYSGMEIEQLVSFHYYYNCTYKI